MQGLWQAHLLDCAYKLPILTGNQGAGMSFDRVQYPLVRDDITVQEIGQEVMLHDTDNGSVHVINLSAYAVWKLCNGKNTPENMFEKLSAEYPDAGPGLLGDIQEILKSFRKKMLLVS
jgi:hypothetical protein